MIYCIMVMSSVTYALKAQSVLARHGIGTRLEKLTKDQTLHGCGYGLRTERKNFADAKAICEKERIKIIEVIDY